MSAIARFASVALTLAVIAGCARTPQQAKAQTRDGTPALASAWAPGFSSPTAGHGFANLPDRGELLNYPGQLARHDGAYTWHRSDLSEAHALHAIADGHLRVTTPSGQVLDFQYDHHVEHPSGDWTWVGHLPGHEDQQTILTFGEHAAFGSIAQPGTLPLRLTSRNGLTWLVETDPRKIAGIDNAATRPQRQDFLVPPKRAGASIGPHADAAAMTASSAPVTTAASASSITTVDLVIGYTPTFASDNGGASGAVTRLNYLVDVANVAYGNSQINAQARLVATVLVTYPDATANEGTLEQLTGYNSTSNTQTTPDPAFNALRAAREQYGADLVSMVRSFREPENGGCGLAWLIGGGQSGVSTSDSYFGYSVVSDGTDAGTDGKTYYCLDESLAHEMGHNMGAAHDVDTAKGSNGILDANEYGAFPYSFGYKSVAGNFYTVMAYGDKGQQIYRIFSDPRSTFCGGNVCGVDGQSDNAQTLTQTIPTVATFRATVVPVTQTQPVRDDVDGDGKSDLLWQNTGTNQFAYWIMHGTAVSRTSVQAIAAGYRIAATGDFNGDGITDLVWTSNARDIWLWIGNGTKFSAYKIGSYASGWTIAGSGDVDGDGHSDLLWLNTSTHRFGYWIMNGTTVVRFHDQAATAGYRVIATDDFNGDGKTDVIWTSNAGDLWLWTGNGTSFAGASIGHYEAGWNLTGSGDVNGDGKADLLWHNTTTNRFGYWIMSGGTVVRFSDQPAMAGYRVVATGDFNGDGKADVVWTSNARDLRLWTGNGTSFSDALIGSYASGWSVASPLR